MDEEDEGRYRAGIDIDDTGRPALIYVGGHYLPRGAVGADTARFRFRQHGRGEAGVSDVGAGGWSMGPGCGGAGGREGGGESD